MEKINIWGETIVAIMTALWGKIAGFMPNLLGAIILLVIGYYIAKAICFLLTQVLERIGVNRISEKVGVAAVIGKANISLGAAEILGKIAFWIIMLTFLITATEALGLPRISETLDEFLLYLPRVIAAALILIIGLLLAHFVRDLVRSGAEGMSVTYAKPLASTAYGILFVVIISLAIGQLEFNTGLLDTVIAIGLAAVGIALALSLGLGTRGISANIVAGYYARELFQTGAKIALENCEGELETVGSVKSTIKCKDGSQMTLANTDLVSSMVRIKPAPVTRLKKK